jgi:2-(1,2-epoxy-1,2-dihydrophenyl)acetyl-CoA isomerase
VTPALIPVDGLEVVADGSVLRVTLQRPEKRNAMTLAMFDGVTAAVEHAAADDTIRVVAIRGAGDHFCSGAQVGVPDRAGEADSDEQPAKPRTGHLQRSLHASPHRMIRTLFETDVPIVTGVRGYAAGIGNALALSGDCVVAARSAKFWVPFVTRGFTPDSGTTFLLPRLIGVARAKEMILRGKPIDGERAAEWGLINEVVDDDDLDDAVEAVVQEFAGAATVSIGLAKQLMYRNLTGDLNGALEQEALAEELAVRSDDFKEGMRAFAQRRDPDYQGR